MFSNKPKMAKKWAKHTKNIKSLPEKEVIESLSVKDFFIFENATKFNESQQGHIAWVVIDTAKQASGGKRRVAISTVYDKLVELGRDSGITLDEFKQELLKLHRSGEIELARTDLPKQYDVDIVQKSTIRDGFAQYDYIIIGDQ